MSDECLPMKPARVYHRAALINNRGGVSALCFEKPRAIDMKRATWTNRDEAVTCSKCRAKLAASLAKENDGCQE